jgi:5-aminopentanamidase
MRIAVFQCDSIFADPEARLDSLEQTASECAGHCDVLVCPELFATGYNIGPHLVRRLAEPLDGVFGHGVMRIARESGMAIVYGHAERDGDRIFNSATCIDHRGLRLGVHRKLFLSGPYEEGAFDTGDRYTTFDLCGIRTGLLICFDVEFPETVRALRRAGCDLILVPTALVGRWVHLTRTLIPTRAFENGVFLVYANYSGTEEGASYCGNSLIAGPDGFERARAGSAEELIFATIDPGDNLRARTTLPYLEKLGRAPITGPDTIVDRGADAASE